MTDRTVVAIGCSTDADYNFLIPLTCLLWRDHIGHFPLALLVGSESEWQRDGRLEVALQALNYHQIPRIWLGHLPSYPDATLAQNCRQHACLSPSIFHETWVMPGDADLWPIRKAFYQAHVKSAHRAVIYYWQGDHFLGKNHFLKAVAAGKRSQTIPTCHVAMRALDWRRIYELEGDSIAPDRGISQAVGRTLEDWFTRTPKDAFNLWMSDQDILTERLCRQEWFPAGTPPHSSPEAHVSGEVLFIPRPGHPPLDRLCRSVPERWLGSFEPERWIDAHVHKVPYGAEVWAMLLPIVHALLPDKVPWAVDYRNTYWEACR